MARMHNPPHPGEVLRDGVFNDATVSVADFAARLGVTRVALSRVLNGKAGISDGIATCGGTGWQRAIVAAHASQLRFVARRACATAASCENRANEICCLKSFRT